MRRLPKPLLLLVPAMAAGCAAHHSNQATLADLHKVRPDLQEVTVEQGLDQAMEGYRRFLEQTPETAMTPEAMRRLADLQLEKQFGIRADGKPRATPPAEAGKKPKMAAPQSGKKEAEGSAMPNLAAGTAGAASRESDKDFEKRTTAVSGFMSPAADEGPVAGIDPSGPLEAIALYEKLLKDYPSYENSDKVLYQMARAYDELGKVDEAMEVMERLIRANPSSVHADEVQFRRGEYFFTRRKFRDAENAYSAVTALGTGSSYYELALYKLGWTFYKQDLYDEALEKYMALLDYKVSVGFDFDATHDEEDDRRVADTFRVISLSFSNLGGPEALQKYFSDAGERTYENRIYSNLGEHYLSKLRYDDAAKTYKAFVSLHPFHKEAPSFSMKVIETFTQGGFPKLVLESKRDFASSYGLKSEYWHHFKPEDRPDVLTYLKSNLKDLATHYHAQYQSEEAAKDKPDNYREARRWYGEYIESFPTDADTPGVNYRLADLMLENKDFGEAAKEYERTAYSYPAHAQSAGAGYAAVYAYREELKSAEGAAKDQVKHDTIVSSIKFADTFPQHEQAATVLGAAADDQYEMKDFAPAVTTAKRVIADYPAAAAGIRRSAWIVVAHGSFELGFFPEAESAYTQVLAATPDGDASRAGFVDNLAASIYKQGEQANAAQDYRAAADNFLRIRTVAPTSSIRPTAEYDAGAALIRLQAWAEAASVLEAFRTAYPNHELKLEATRQIANAYREAGQLSRSAGEYEGLASASKDETVRRESLLLAGDLYQQSQATDKAVGAYRHFLEEFPHPVEPALEARFKIAEIHKAGKDQSLYLKELREIVDLDAHAGGERTGRTKTIAARSALVLAEQVYGAYTEAKLKQPFDAALAEKKKRMDAALTAMDTLVDYEIADVTSAATYYTAETYFDLSRDLAESERPADLQGAELTEYEQELDEEAYPFEEKAIDFHEKNLEMMRKGGVFNPWIEKSLARLASMMPGRYNKPEANLDFLDSVDSYIYRNPVQPATPVPAGTQTAPAGTQAAPAPADPAAEPTPAPGKKRP